MQRGMERGMTLPELLVYIGVALTIGMLVAGVAGTIFSRTSQEEAFGELMTIKSAAQNYRSAPLQAGLYEDVSIAELAGKGYLGIMATGTNESAYGMTVTIAAANSDTDALITYPTPTDADCQMFIQRFYGTTAVKSVTCAAATLSLTIE